MVLKRSLTKLFNYSIIEWPLFDARTSTHDVFTSFSLSKCCYLHFCRNKLGSCWRNDIFKGRYLMRQQVPMVFLLLLVYLNAVANISVEISLGSCWSRYISKGRYLMRQQVLMVFLLLLVYLSAATCIS